MGHKEILVESEEVRSRQEVASFLREIADKLEAGSLTVTKGDETVTLQIPERVTLEFEVRRKTKPGKTKQSLEIEIEWGSGESEGIKVA